MNRGTKDGSEIEHKEKKLSLTRTKSFTLEHHIPMSVFVDFLASAGGGEGGAIHFTEHRFNLCFHISVPIIVALFYFAGEGAYNQSCRLIHSIEFDIDFQLRRYLSVNTKVKNTNTAFVVLLVAVPVVFRAILVIF